MNTTILVRNVNKSFRNVQVLKDVSMSVNSGEIVGLVGNNGSGKSVLLKCICGLIKPDSGQIIVHEKILGKDIDFPDNIGAIIESPGFLPQRSGYTNLYYLWSIKRRQPKGIINEVMNIVGLDPKEKKRVGKYSMGMRQRLSIAQALIEDPKTLILDEPFNGLDKHALHDMRLLVMRLNKEGKTIIISSHNPQDINTCCSRVYELDEGVMSLAHPPSSATYTSVMLQGILSYEVPQAHDKNDLKSYY